MAVHKNCERSNEFLCQLISLAMCTNGPDVVAMYARVNERLRDRAGIIRMIVKFNVFAWRTLHSHLAMGTAVYRQDQGGNERSELAPKLLLLK